MKANSSDRNTVGTWIANIGMIIILIAIAMPLIFPGNLTYRYILPAGALLTLAGRIITPRLKNNSLRVRRLHRMQLWSAILFCASAAAMFYPGLRPTDWLAFTLAAAVLQAYASIMLPRAQKA